MILPVASKVNAQYFSCTFRTRNQSVNIRYNWTADPTKVYFYALGQYLHTAPLATNIGNKTDNVERSVTDCISKQSVIPVTTVIEFWEMDRGDARSCQQTVS